jgi:purine-binding chemotaxis protein CheW
MSTPHIPHASRGAPSAPAEPRGSDRAVVCRVDGWLCALPVGDVVETMRPLPIRRLAAAPPYVAGLAMIRGAAVPVIETAALLRMNGDEDGGKQRLDLRSVPVPIPVPGGRPRFVLVGAGDRAVALMVDEVLGVPALPRASVSALPPLLGGASDDTIASLGALDAELLVVLRAAGLLPESTWEELRRIEGAP